MNYDLSQITEFWSLIKLQRDFNISLDSDLVGGSTSGLSYNVGVNPLITLRNIYAFMPTATEMGVNAWSASVTYDKDEAVYTGSVYYRSLVDGNINHIVNLSTYWAVTTLQSIWMRQKLKGLHQIVLSKALLADKLFDSVKMYNIGTSSSLITNTSKYVGFEIRPKGSEHLLIALNRIACQLTTSQSLTLKLYNQNTFVADIVLSSTENELVFTDITDQLMSGEGRWFLFYNQDDLTGQAYSSYIEQGSKYCDLLSFEIPNTTTDFINTIDTYSNQCYGLGLDFSIYADLTQFIKSNIQSFAEVLHLEWQYQILEMFIMNPDVQFSGIERSMIDEKKREIIYAELHNTEKGVDSLVKRRFYAYKKLIKSLESKGDKALSGQNNQFIYYDNIG